MTVLLVPFLVSCSSTSQKQNSEIDLHVQKPEDVTRLKNTETALTVTPEKAALHPEYQTIERIAVPYIPEYRIGPSDVVEIVYHIRYDRTNEEYRLEIQDKISLHFPYHPQFSTTVLVRTDGRITVPLIGEVHAASKTPRELAALLNREYSKYINNPSITVALEEFNVKIEELKRAITTAPRGQSKIAPVTPDGRISFPIIGSLHAEGLTVDQLEKIVNDKYETQVRNLRVTLILLEIHHPKFYVVGEVSRPGAYEMTSRISLLDALALANGHKKSARLSDVVVFRNDGLERPIAFKVDLEAALKQGATHVNLPVKPADIIYVPKTRLDEFNDLVEKVFTRGLYAIAPFQSNFTVNYDIRNPSIR
ncbi:MAG TPA: polysaccharide biosynthesis/export family protein [Syntrophobacteraceae bacterium]|nr:polysaccharide biosynthesis/export family protein [Syntrophobacteraceae bacterium]